MQAPNWTDFLQCSICTLKYNCTNVVPISLNCSHAMCKRCIARLQTKQCPYDKSIISANSDKFPPNTAFLHLLGHQPESWAHEMIYLCPTIIPDSELEGYTSCREGVEKLALFLKPHVDQGLVQATASIPRPILKKLTSLLSNQILEGESRVKAVRAAQSIAERIITELLVMHQNQHQISTALWTTVRSRGCQFLGPVMQEEALKLILKCLEKGLFLSRKNIVMYVVGQLSPGFPNASKTNIGHVVQLLYRASCFNVQKRDGDSSLMQLKEEFCSYEALRREHDAQIVKIAMEAGLRISPETWSTLLYGNTNKKSEMQSIIDKLVSMGVGSTGISELIVAIGRTQDQHNLIERLVSHLDALIQLDVPLERNNERSESPELPITCSWEVCAVAFNELLIVLEVFTEFAQHYSKELCPEAFGHGQVKSGRYKTGMCPYLNKPGGCPRGALCPYAHSEEERKKYVNMAKPNKALQTSSNTKLQSKTRQDILQTTLTSSTTTAQYNSSSTVQRRTDLNTSTGSLPLNRYPSEDMGSLSEGSYFEHSSSYPGNGGNVLYHTSDVSPPDSAYFVRPGGRTEGGGFYREDAPTNYTTNNRYPPPPNSYEGGEGVVYNSTDNNRSSYMYQQQSMGKLNHDHHHISGSRTHSIDSASSMNNNDFDTHHNYESYRPPRGNHSNELTVDMATTTSSTDSTPVTTSNFYPPSSQEEMGGAAIVNTLAEDAWKYKIQDGRHEGSVSSYEESFSDENTEDGEKNDRLYYDRVIECDDSKMVPRGGVVNEVGVANSKEEETMEELRAKIKVLEMQLVKKEETVAPPIGTLVKEQHYHPPPSHTGSSHSLPHPPPHPSHSHTRSHTSHHPHSLPPTHPHSSLPHSHSSLPPSHHPHHQMPYYNNSPQNSGFISTVPPPHPSSVPFGHPQQQYIQMAPAPSYYDPFTGGLPNQLWCPPPVHSMSPQSTPPNSGLIAIHHVPPPHGSRPVPNMDPSLQMQMQLDENVAHYIAFQEQSKAPMGMKYPIAPGAQLATPIPPPHSHPMHHPGAPMHHYGFEFPHMVVPRPY